MTVTFYQVEVKVNHGKGAVSVSVTPHESLCDGKFHVVTGMTSHADITPTLLIHEKLRILDSHVIVLQFPDNLKLSN